jgi:transcription termination/antitermination protein NusG
MSAFRSGENVLIRTGPFANFTGVVTDVDEIGRSLTVVIEVFGRPTSVEVSFADVEKLKATGGQKSDFTGPN